MMASIVRTPLVAIGKGNVISRTALRRAVARSLQMTFSLMSVDWLSVLFLTNAEYSYGHAGDRSPPV